MTRRSARAQPPSSPLALEQTSHSTCLWMSLSCDMGSCVQLLWVLSLGVPLCLPSHNPCATAVHCPPHALHSSWRHPRVSPLCCRMHSAPVLYQNGSLKYESFQDGQDDIAQSSSAGLLLPVKHQYRFCLYKSCRSTGNCKGQTSSDTAQKPRKPFSPIPARARASPERRHYAPVESGVTIPFNDGLLPKKHCTPLQPSPISLYKHSSCQPFTVLQ